MTEAAGPASTPVWPPPSPALTRMLFGALPMLAALGPLLSVFGGLYGYRIVCAGLVAYAGLFLLARSPWSAADVWLLLTTASFAVAGVVGLPRITGESDNPYSELLAIVLGLTTALASRAWQRCVPSAYLALARGWVVAALAMAVVAAGELATGIHLPGYLESADPEPAAAFGNPNALAIFIVMANVWAIPVRRAGGRLWVLSTWALVPASAAVIYYTNARIALFVWLLVLAWSAWCGVRRSRHGLAGLAQSLVPAAAAVVFLALAGRLVGYGTEIATPDSSGGVREELTRRGLTFAVEHRGLPTWPGSFEALMEEHGDLKPVAELVNAHDLWVEMLVQYGALSLVLFLAWAVACVVSGSGARDETSIGVVALLLLGLVDSSFLDDATLWLFVLTFAMASRVGPPERSSRATPVPAHRIGAP